MQTILRFIPIEVIFAFLTNYLTSTIKNPASVRASSLRPLLVHAKELIEALLVKLDTPQV